jgi:PAS domain S-box-containing protein
MASTFDFETPRITMVKDIDEASLNPQALRYKTLMETSTDSIYVLDSKGNLQDANAAFLRRRGYTAAQAKELNVADWDAQWSREQLDERRRRLVGKSAVFETRHRCKDGSIFDVEVSATSVQIGGEQLIFCVARDITERKQADEQLRRSEEKFKALFNIVPVGIAVLDSQLHTVDCNPALEQISQLSREEMLGEAWQRRTYINADGTVRLPGERVIERAVAEKRLVSRVETGVLMESGEVVWAEVSVAPLALPDATAVVVAQDITERKRAAKELQRANDRLRILSRQLFHLQEEERRHLARELHDEIGQNLTAAKINLEIIAPGMPAKLAGRVEDSVQLLDRLLAQIRQLSLSLRPPLLDEFGLPTALRSLLEQQAQRAGLRTQFRAREPFTKLSPDIQTAGFRIVQEAITNVLRHAKARMVGVHLEIEGDNLRMKIVDDGIGFEPAEVDRQAHEGVGLGLMGMRERAAVVGGQVQITSSPEKGTSVEVSLPLNGSSKVRHG